MVQIYIFNRPKTDRPGEKNGSFLKMFSRPPPKKMLTEKNGNGATIRIGQEIQCLPHAGFFLVLKVNTGPCLKRTRPI